MAENILPKRKNTDAFMEAPMKTEELESDIHYFRNCPGKEIKNVLQAARHYQAILPLLEKLIEGRELATQGEWVGRKSNSDPEQIVIQADGAWVAGDMRENNAQFVECASKAVYEIAKIIKGDGK